MNSCRSVITLAALLSTAAMAQQPQVERPQLSTRQLDASRAMTDMTRSPSPSKRPSLLAEPANRSIFVDTGLLVDPRQPAPRSMTEQLKEAACSSDVAVVGMVENMTSFLNEDASFILTEYVIRIDAVLRGRGLEIGSTLSYVRSGGSLNIGGRIVTATHNMYPPLHRGQTYVLFAKRIGQGPLYKPTNTTIDILAGGDKTLRGLGPEAEPQLRRGVESGSVKAEITSAHCGR